MNLTRRLASIVGARARCLAKGDENWASRHEQTALELVKRYMPSGSGVDAGTTLDFDASNEDRLVFATSFHHMDEHGSYDGWTEHKVIVTASLAFEFNVRITGRDRNEIKDYLAELFNHALHTENA